MSAITLDCPHCFQRDIKVDIIGMKRLKTSSKKHSFSMIGFCMECEQGIALNAEAKTELQNDILSQPSLDTNFIITKTFPNFPENKYIEHLTVPDIEILLEYKNSKGEVSNRRIRVKSMEYKIKKKEIIPLKLHSYCLERKMSRDFNIPRIINAYDGDTGELIQNLYHHLSKTIGTVVE